MRGKGADICTVMAANRLWVASKPATVMACWTHHDLGDRLNLRLQCAKSTRRGAPDEIDSHYMMMTKNQAAILANYLLKIAGQTPPKPHQPSLIARIIGS